MDAREARALERVLSRCASTSMEPIARTAAPARRASQAPVASDALRRYDDNRNGRITCAQARRHGIAPLHRSHSGRRRRRNSGRPERGKILQWTAQARRAAPQAGAMYDDEREQAVEDLTFDVKQGLRKARPFFPPGRAGQDDDTTLGLVAETVVEHLRHCRWQLHRLPPLAPHAVGTGESDDSFEPSRGP